MSRDESLVIAVISLQRPPVNASPMTYSESPYARAESTVGTPYNAADLTKFTASELQSFPALLAAP
ncbi:hypothetical protein [Methylophaga sp.]|uniref:hypothetical protein n=1 Tax=Methylophaga sp. TaxID=2024840 RepID=UPI003A8E5B65